MPKADIWFILTFLQSGLSLSSEGILGPLTPDLPADGLDLSDIPPAEEVEAATSEEEESE